ncbi:PREDICTED: protein MULTIPLE CHLOROPLAST DIVISION SITE 1 [Camelina sativa]|uniref:Protein MULTIPLE CHLOROPLAST DIVISION SITE 1 n=1 Tax=Camelina sativa TaxID=90675 RepID=A0ABM0VQS1_CAMSA|nr:PREDICTED: protein MULTIPLE CHLOROPLAST DIVISION SITE 1 [Camelina sativa]
MASIDSLQFHSLCNVQSSIGRRAKLRIPSNLVVFRRRPVNLNWVQVETKRRFVCRAIGDSSTPDEDIQNTQNDDDVVVVVASTESNTPSDSENSVSRFRSMITTLPPVVFVMKKCSGNGIWIGICIAATVLVAAVRTYVVRKSRDNQPAGSVADLVRRGQLRSGDRRGISKSLNYEDPFNNPFVKLDKGNSTVEMCGKVYRLAPVTLTEKEQTIHQKRRSRAYQWKRPTTFLKEGDSIPPDVDPDTIRWIPANHPFATTVSDIDQDLAQTNVYQKQGVPFRIRAEHEAMQKKLEALQNEEKLNNLSIDSQNAREFQRPYKLGTKLEGENIQKNSQDNVTGNSSSEETHKT